ncbi:D-tyrosyl-tRNA(Tyr) deacylase [Corynebacterium sp. sy017]|uniref:D-aminoacyl-tRNA deacylase n=1 Tax=unclassified Corynebacterium TaxID=2624378 RepID=UPI0011871A61|nr:MULTISPECIES: D-aminoacyl-tRNA deacylase [unclassified Corynebacterium]MBP3087761.1 D-tyrosyl-tRNA(Tyr) deacylase [Corynebacterium sp. sy017]QDZ42735.1 D-tyrosyl-tRNA(Tyr) deacylase [Corynebacterium sp. sy039]TSD92310.1 D-tyrosyl-tRNA(Tyr) deacylase [Corynebacterium sp. SY003]
MKAVLTRVSYADVRVKRENNNDGTECWEKIAEIKCSDSGGILALVGVARSDDSTDAALMARKIAELRILAGEKNVEQAHAPVLLVSQFTLLGQTAKGRRPSWSEAAPSELAHPLIEEVALLLRERGIYVEQGQFGAHMKVSSTNDGPFTVLVET